MEISAKVFDINAVNLNGGPTNALVMASDGNLWGTSASSRSMTVLYKIGIDGTLQTTVLDCAQGGSGTPSGALMQASNGKLYGAGAAGGCGGTIVNTGTVFSVDAGLPVPPSPVIAAVTNGASFAAGSLVPGEIATAFGSSLTSATGINLSSSLPLPTSLMNSTVLVNGCAATPLFAVDNVNGQQQINFQAPWEIAGQQAVAVQIVNSGGISPAVDIPVLAAQPGVINYALR